MKVTKDQLIAYANTLYNEADNPEYLRGMVELIAYAVQESEDFEQTVEEVEYAILSNVYHFYYRTEEGYEACSVRALSAEEAETYLIGQGYNLAAACYLDPKDADDSLYCKLHDC